MIDDKLSLFLIFFLFFLLLFLFGLFFHRLFARGERTSFTTGPFLLVLLATFVLAHVQSLYVVVVFCLFYGFMQVKQLLMLIYE